MSLRREVAREAYVWGLPTVRLYGILHELVLAPEQNGSGNHLNRLLHGAFPAAVADLVGPPASGEAEFCAWLDLRRGPLRVEPAPDTAVGGPAVTALLDLYSDVIGAVPEDIEAPVRPYLLTGPSWEPPSSADVSVAVLRCPTDLCFAVARSRRDEASPGAGPRPEVLRVRPCSGEDREPLPLPTPVPPVDTGRPPTMAFLRALDWMLALMPPRPGEEDLRADLQMLGVACGPAGLGEAEAEDLLDGEVTGGLRLGFEDVRRGGGTSWLRTLPHVR